MISCKQILFISCLAFSTIVFAVLGCGQDQFECKSDSTCIDSYLLCDAHKDCSDGSDETYEECLQIKCPSHSFQCGYGACIPMNRVCDGTPDCVDKTDEGKTLCTIYENRTSFDDYLNELRGDCSDEFTMKCKDKDDNDICIGLESICDGNIDCYDQKDESSDLCIGINCPTYAFRCAYGGCINKMLQCDHVVNCHDKSDEIDRFCFEKSTKDKLKLDCYFGDDCVKEVPLVNKNFSWTIDKVHEKSCMVPALKSCTLPTQPLNLQSIDGITNDLLTANQSVPSGAIVNFQCKQKYRMEGKAINFCHDGKWIFPLPSLCEPLCAARLINEGVSTIRHCTHNGKPVNCLTASRPNTLVQFSCAPFYKPKQSTPLYDVNCGKSGSWSSKAPKCEPICSDIADDRAPWTVSIYQRTEKPIFEWLCSGAILSAKIVLTSGICFNSLGFSGANSNDPFFYNVVEGKQTESYDQNQVYSLGIHNVSQIISNVQYDINNDPYPITLVILVDYFRFATQLKPFCLNQQTIAPKFPVIDLPLMPNAPERGELLGYEISGVTHILLIFNFSDRSKGPTALFVNSYNGIIKTTLERYELIY